MKALPFRKEMQALVQLLCKEESLENTRLVRNRILEHGEPAIPILEEILNRHELTGRDRLVSVKEEIQRKIVIGQLGMWAKRQGGLEEGAFLLARFGYPNVDAHHYKHVLDAMAAILRPKLKSVRQATRLVNVFNQYFFRELGFRGNTLNYYDPDNSYLNCVLDRRMGIPITLSCVILLLSARLNLPMTGVGFPGHFLVRYEAAGGEEIYIDAFNHGRLQTRQQCEKILIQAGYGCHQSFFASATPPEMLIRMMRNLIHIYHQKSEPDKAIGLSQSIAVIADLAGNKED